MRRFTRQPLVHFVLIGGVLFIGSRLLASADRPVIELGATRIEQLERSFVASLQREPRPSELEALRRDAVDEELLFREALSRGLHRVDPVVRSRLVRNMRFAGLGDETDGDAALFGEALELGLERSDPIVRRRLVHHMKLEIMEPVEVPSSEEVRARHVAHGHDLVAPAQVRFTHLFFSRDGPGPARELLARLRTDSVAPDVAARESDPFALGLALPLQTLPQIARSFGVDFATALQELEPRAWVGPLESAFGTHLVWIHDRRPARRLSLGEVAKQLDQQLYEERRRVALRVALEDLREQYTIRSRVE